ncbi:MAG: type II toxin-antitoxin system VapC family toxin [Micropepsaceae bacterium]
MRGWLLDTNVISELRKPNPNATVTTWVDSQPQTSLFASPVTLAEIRFGIERAQEAQRKQLFVWLETVRQWLGPNVVAIDEDTLIAWRNILETLRRTGRPVGPPDTLIAASARQQGFCVATRNAEEFVYAGVPVFNPWENILKTPDGRTLKINGLMTLDRVR